MLSMLGCAGTERDGVESEEPPGEDPAAEVFEAMDGRAVAQWRVEPKRFDGDGQVVLQVVNRGELPLNYGRPILVEGWDGSAWSETEGSRQSMWTMDLLQVGPGEAGIEQTWPFRREADPEPGWYRFTKQVYAESDGGETEQMLLRGRVEVR